MSASQNQAQGFQPVENPSEYLKENNEKFKV